MKRSISILASFLLPFSLISCQNEKSKTGPDAGEEKTAVSPANPAEQEMREMKEAAEKQKQPKENPYKNAKIEIKTFDNAKSKSSEDVKMGGFGYDIYIFDAQYVHQPNVPAINGNRGFKTKEQAQKAGELVAYKIRNNIMPPSVTIQELDSLGVLK